MSKNKNKRIVTFGNVTINTASTESIEFIADFDNNRIRLLAQLRNGNSALIYEVKNATIADYYATKDMHKIIAYLMYRESGRKYVAVEDYVLSKIIRNYSRDELKYQIPIESIKQEPSKKELLYTLKMMEDYRHDENYNEYIRDYISSL